MLRNTVLRSPSVVSRHDVLLFSLLLSFAFVLLTGLFDTQLGTVGYNYDGLGRVECGGTGTALMYLPLLLSVIEHGADAWRLNEITRDWEKGQEFSYSAFLGVSVV